MQIIAIVDFYYSSHILFLNQIYNLATICDDFQRLTGH